MLQQRKFVILPNTREIKPVAESEPVFSHNYEHTPHGAPNARITRRDEPMLGLILAHESYAIRGRRMRC
jgi:hypothetical protein